MRALLGAEYPAFLAALDAPAEKGLRVNLRFIDKERLLPLLAQDVTPIPYQEGGYYYRGHLGAHPLHQAGAFYLQDPSAMLTANAVDIQPGSMVLDMCAAPGGKSTQLAAMVGEAGLLVSNEIDLGRAKTLMGNIERMGAARTVVCNLPPEEVAALWGARFDVVVVDAPCSGEGMFRKNPAAVAEWSPDNVLMCAKRQRRILDSAMRCVRQGGLLVYSTCTFAPEEDEESVRYLLESGHFEPVAPTQRVLAATTCAADTPYCRRFYPHLGRGEGHFVAVLRRKSPHDVPPKMAPPRGLPQADAVCVRGFLGSVLADIPQGDLVYIGNAVCLVPQGTSLPRYGVLSAGVKLGEVARGKGGLRFTPHHMLFKCLPTVGRLNLACDDPRVTAYLHGDSVQAEVPNGWGTVCVEGCPLGGYKSVDGTIKNHYPKGLRV